MVCTRLRSCSSRRYGRELRGWRAFPSYTRVRTGSGCYAYQIDGTTFSKVLVFRLEK